MLLSDKTQAGRKALVREASINGVMALARHRHSRRGTAIIAAAAKAKSTASAWLMAR